MSDRSLANSPAFSPTVAAAPAAARQVAARTKLLLEGPVLSTLLRLSAPNVLNLLAIAGMIMAAKALLDRNPQPSAADVRQALVDNLCRCGTHNRIVRAVLRAAQNGGRI